MLSSRHLLLALAGLLLSSTVPAMSHDKRPITQTGQSSVDQADIPGIAPAVTQSVNGERLVNARKEPQNWMTYYGAYDGQRYSALDQVSAENVKSLRPAWVFQYGVVGLVATPATYSFEAAPIVVDGVMYVSGWDGYVWAINAETGKLLWVYQHAIPLDTPLCCGNVNRGVAVANGKVFVATPNGHLLALNATDGKPVWEKIFVDVRAGETATMAPLVVHNKVIVGSSGAEYGVRGHIDAFDVDTGNRVWRRYTVPRPGEPGGDTWKGDAWARGGGTAWITGTYDPALNILYWGTGNPGPDFDGGSRPGDNLYTDCVLALNPDDGAIRWHYQWTPHDLWDFDGVNENILFDQAGKKLLAHFDRNGYLFILDRTNGTLIHATPYDRVTWGQIDPNTGRVTVLKEPTREGTVIYPGPAGAKEWPHACFNPQTGLLYTPTIDAGAVFKLSPMKYEESMPFWGGDASVLKGNISGHIKAIDPRTGKEVWSWKGKHPMVSSLLTTAGGLVFAGEPTGEFDAFDAKTGALLWQFQTGTGIHGNPVTYSANGKQYIAITCGWGGWLEGFAPEMFGAPRGDALFVFSLPTP